MQILRLNTVSFINIIKKISSTIEGISLQRRGGLKTVFFVHLKIGLIIQS